MCCSRKIISCILLIYFPRTDPTLMFSENYIIYKLSLGTLLSTGHTPEFNQSSTTNLSFTAACSSSWINVSASSQQAERRKPPLSEVWGMWSVNAAFEWRNVCVEQLYLTSRPCLTSLSLCPAWRNADRSKKDASWGYFLECFVWFCAWWSWSWGWFLPWCSPCCSFSSVSVSAGSLPTFWN